MSKEMTHDLAWEVVPGIKHGNSRPGACRFDAHSFTTSVFPEKLAAFAAQAGDSNHQNLPIGQQLIRRPANLVACFQEQLMEDDFDESEEESGGDSDCEARSWGFNVGFPGWAPVLRAAWLQHFSPFDQPQNKTSLPSLQPAGKLTGSWKTTVSSSGLGSESILAIRHAEAASAQAPRPSDKSFVAQLRDAWGSSTRRELRV